MATRECSDCGTIHGWDPLYCRERQEEKIATIRPIWDPELPDWILERLVEVHRSPQVRTLKDGTLWIAPPWAASILGPKRRTRPKSVQLKNLEGCVAARDLGAHFMLMLQAQEAVDSILASTAHKEGLVDKVYNEVALPGALWRIARDLRDCVRQLDKLPEDSRTDELRGAVETRRRVIGEAVGNVAKRVAVLSEYAAKLVELDVRRSEIAKLDELEGACGGLMNLVTRTTSGASGDVDFSEIKGLASTAKDVTDAFARALEDVREASLAASKEMT